MVDFLRDISSKVKAQGNETQYILVRGLDKRIGYLGK